MTDLTTKVKATWQLSHPDLNKTLKKNSKELLYVWKVLPRKGHLSGNMGFSYEEQPLEDLSNFPHPYNVTSVLAIPPKGEPLLEIWGFFSQHGLFFVQLIHILLFYLVFVLLPKKDDVFVVHPLFYKSLEQGIHTRIRLFDGIQ